MTREEAIEAIVAEKLQSAPQVKLEPQAFKAACIRMGATAAFDAMEPHIQAERERVREACADFCDEQCNLFDGYTEGCEAQVKFYSRVATAIRAMDIGCDDG